MGIAKKCGFVTAYYMKMKWNEVKCQRDYKACSIRGEAALE